MARPVRIEYPGAMYHVMNRGNQRNQVFFTKDDYKLFLEKLSIFAEEYNIQVICYCLMPNHFHLYLRTPEANLSRFMQSCLTSFSITMNRKRGKSGHLFQGRFKSHLVDDAAYGMVLSRYIHLNPVRTKNLSELSTHEQINYLDNFSWSTYKSYAGLIEMPDWIHSDVILTKFEASNLRDQQQAYAEYVKEGIIKDIDNPFESVKKQTILGDDTFVEKIKRKYILNLNLSSSKDQPVLANMQSSFSFDEIAEKVAELFKLDKEEILKKRSKHRTAKRFLAYCAVKYCKSQVSLSYIGEKMNIGGSGLSRSKDRFSSELEQNPELKTQLNILEKELKSIAEM